MAEKLTTVTITLTFPTVADAAAIDTVVNEAASAAEAIATGEVEGTVVIESSSNVIYDDED